MSELSDAVAHTKLENLVDKRLLYIINELTWHVGQFAGFSDGTRTPKKYKDKYPKGRSYQINANPLTPQEIVWFCKNYPVRIKDDKAELGQYGAEGSATRKIVAKIPKLKVLLDPNDLKQSTFANKFRITTNNSIVCSICLPEDPDGNIILRPLTINVGGKDATKDAEGKVIKTPKQTLVFDTTVDTGISASGLVANIIKLKNESEKKVVSKSKLLGIYYKNVAEVAAAEAVARAAEKAKKEAEAKAKAAAEGGASKERVEVPAPKKAAEVKPAKVAEAKPASKPQFGSPKKKK